MRHILTQQQRAEPNPGLTKLWTMLKRSSLRIQHAITTGLFFAAYILGFGLSALITYFTGNTVIPNHTKTSWTKHVYGSDEHMY